MSKTTDGIMAYTALTIDACQKGEDVSVPAYIRDEFGWLDPSGIFLNNMCVENYEGSKWQRYIFYLIQWAFNHSGEEFSGQSPACFDEWDDNEDE